MIYNRNVSGIEIMLRIDNYQSPAKHSFGDWWCDCGFSFKFGNIINYSVEHDELLMPEDIDGLTASLTELLNGNIEEPTEEPMTEPDFVFELYPQKDLRTDPKYTYISPGHEIQDIYVEWRIFFWDDGLTSNYLTITLDRDDIISFRDFLNSCRTE